MFQHDWTCCICRDRGRSVQVHHIDEDPRNHATDNLAVLCLEDHDNTQIRGGFGKRFKAADVRIHRDDWVRRVNDRRNKADELVIKKSARIQQAREITGEWTWPSEAEVVGFIKALPAIRTAASEIVRSHPNVRRSNTGMINATYEAIEFLKSAWLRLAKFYPAEHFDEMAADQYVSEFLALRTRWHRKLYEPRGPATGGTIVRVLVAGCVCDDIEDLIKDTVEGLFKAYSLYGSDIATTWRNAWQAAGQAA